MWLWRRVCDRCGDVFRENLGCGCGGECVTGVEMCLGEIWDVVVEESVGRVLGRSVGCAFRESA